MADNTNKTIIVRNQHRRGLKQDLPQPLRPGEIGLAVDSRQVYIGGDPNDPHSADYNAVSYFENTLSAREHTISIANNQVIAFQVPFVKFSRGEYNGISTIKQWQSSDARSIISSTNRPACKYTSSDYTVFSPVITEPVVSTIALSSGGGTLIRVTNVGGTDPTGNIRVGDIVTGPDIVGDVFVVGVTVDQGSGDYLVTVNTSQTTTTTEEIVFTPVNIKSLITNKPFSSADVIVKKNGIQLIADPDKTQVTSPRANVDYVLDGREVISSGSHILSLRTRPSPKDTITVSYYDKDAVVLALEGVNGQVSPYVNYPSFYDAYNVPFYRQIPTENIRLSTTTGLGFIGLQNKHIVSSADGGNIATPSSLSLGNLYISRNDIIYSTGNVTVNITNADQFDIEIDDPNVDDLEDFFSTQAFTGTAYSNSMVRISTGIGNKYFNKKAFHIIDTTNPTLTIQIPKEEFAISRSGEANPKIGVTGGITITADSEGIQVNDYVRIVDDTGNVANTSIHDTVFRVTNVRAGAFDVNVATVLAGNTNPTYSGTTEQVAYINHGPDAANVDTTLQFFSVRHDLTTEITDIIVTTDDSGVTFTEDVFDYAIDNTRLTANTFLVTGFTDGMPAGDQLDVTGNFMPKLAASYTQVTVTPVLRIDLSANTTLTQAITTVNKNTITIGTTAVEDNYVLMDYLPQENGDLNAVYISQDPAFSSVDVGGLEFSLYEDRFNPTLSVLNIEPGHYTRENSSLKSKLEQWFNGVVGSRDVNLFANVFIGGDPYAANADTGNLGRYDLVIDDTFGEIDFCSREEASDFNYIVNSAYSESVFDRSEDDNDGTRGLINLKNNLELQTREASTTGEKVLTYVSMETKTILISDNPGASVIELDLSTYNNFIVEYSIREQNSVSNKYSRVGTMHISGRDDFSDLANAVVLTDNYSSTYELPVGDVVEPKFTGSIDGDKIVISLQGQNSMPSDPANGTIVSHTIGTQLQLRYVYRRWV